ncbi:hypothetical protein R3P38DRAFT_2930257 [Favolaschia claudopus]|uniref:RING-type E3 ubiquitin transferase n=1 Tax=Favolaschia claudopus TaxID=2862362 RepID=A0AAW0BUC9_9AGAR
MSTASAPARPITSKSRGICKYYATDRGCFAGNSCKFLHGEAATHTPYDQAKTCRFYAAGFCKRGNECWFSHAKGKEKEQAIEEEDDLCSICFDKPVTYGLLTGCNHIFCITCIKQWRDPATKSLDFIESGNIKCCPMCRRSAKFIIPSSQFFVEGEAKDAAMARYMDSMKRVPCKHFQKSLFSARGTPFCPFGKDCFYQHRNADGTDHVSSLGVDECMRQYASQRDAELGPSDFHRSGLMRQLENVFAESARLGLGPRMPGFPEDGPDDNTQIRRRLEILADQMLASLTRDDSHYDSDGPSDEEEDSMPPLERINPPLADDWPLPLMFDSDTDGEMPALASVSNSSDSETSSDAGDSEDNYSSTQELGDVLFERVRPFDLMFGGDIGGRGDTTDGTAFMRLQALLGSEAGPSVADPTRAVDDTTADTPSPEGDEADDESEMPPLSPLEHDPPFVTDGRGRVVWSSSSDSGTGPTQQAGSSAPCRASVSVPGAFPSDSSCRNTPVESLVSPRPGGGFTTDGRGRVIGTMGARGREEEEDVTVEQTGSTSTTTSAPTRTFFGRVLDVFF